MAVEAETMVAARVPPPIVRTHRLLRRGAAGLRWFARISLICGTGVAAALAVAQFGTDPIIQMSPIVLIGLVFMALAAWFAVRTAAAVDPLLNILGEAFDELPDPRLIAASDGRTTHANLAFARAFGGIDAASLDRIERLAADASAAATFRSLRERAAAGAAATATLGLHLGDGGPTRQFEISVETRGASPRYRLWIFRDIGARHPKESGPAEPCAVFAELCDLTSNGFCCLDSTGRFLAVNRTLAQWLDVNPAEIVGGEAKLDDFLAVSPPAASPGDPRGATAERGAVALRTRRGDLLDAWIERGCDGRAARGLVYAVLRPSAGFERGVAIRQSRALFQRFFADAPVGIAVVDRAGRFIKANRALGRLFDAAPETLIGCGLISLLNPEDREALVAKLATAAGGREDRTPVEIRLERPGERSERTMVLLLGQFVEAGDECTKPSGPDSGVAPVAPINPASDSVEEPAGALTLYFIDVTEQKHLETQFVQSQKMQAVGQLAGGIAHDFNNLLTAMIGFCDLLLLRSRPGDPVFADIMQIKQNANRAANLVRQLLAFSRQQSLQPRVLDITDVLVELSHLLRRLIGENIELEFVHGRNLGLVKVDQGQLEQVVINLAVNARDAMPNGGRLTIRTENARQLEAARRGDESMPAGDYVLIEVADIGTGIAPDHLARIFEPFFSTKEVGSGTGLGLSTVYGIVKQTGGFVFVDSNPGRGTTFSIYLPRHRPAEGVTTVRPDPAEPALPRDLTGTGTIMLVEDDDAVRMFGARALRNKGYRVVEAKSGEAALELIRNAVDPIDLLITDVVMPQMDGPSLIREVRSINTGIRVIYISGYTEDAFRERLDQDSHIHFLPKPFNLKQLVIKVKDVISSDLRTA